MPRQPDAHTYAHAFADLSHVSGACQFFRRPCFDEIGGYVPMKQGGIDWVAVTTARMRGWTTRTFVEKASFHHRTMGTADRSLWRARFNHGQKDYLVGGHPLWQLLRSSSRCGIRPDRPRRRVPDGWLRQRVGAAKTSPVPAELRAFHRREQDGPAAPVRAPPAAQTGAAAPRFHCRSLTNPDAMTSTRPLRVCHLAYTFYEFDNRVMRYVRTLSDRGDEVDVSRCGSPAATGASPSEGRASTGSSGGRGMRRRSTYLLKLVWFLPQVARPDRGAAARRRYDVVHVHNIPDFLVFSAWCRS